MNNQIRLKSAYDYLQAPYIRVEATVTQPGITNGKPNIMKSYDYIVAPSGKKISTYIVNQIFGSDLVTQTQGLSINWLMPTLKKSLELAVYEEESFILINKYDGKIYLECIKKSDIHDLVQIYETNEDTYELHREIKLENGITYMFMKPYKVDAKGKLTPIDINVFNKYTGSDYISKYVLPYENLINIDIGENFFKDSKKFLNEEMEIFNTIVDEIEKTKTRIATSQHYQSGDIVSNWQPGSNHYKVDTITVGKLADYFTLLPGDKNHQIFQFLQGEKKKKKYITTFKFCDYQVIQMAGLSPVSFGYEKDEYQNKDSVDLSKNNSDMTIEAIKTQIEPQINKLIENIVKAQQSNNITINAIPNELNWNYGANEKFDDMKKLQVLGKIQSVGSIPYSIKAKIIMPILNKLIDDDYSEKNKKLIEDLIKANDEEEKALRIEYGEV